MDNSSASSADINAGSDASFDAALLALLERAAMRDDQPTCSALTALGLATVAALAHALEDPDTDFKAVGLSDLRRRKLADAVKGHGRETAISQPPEPDVATDAPTTPPLLTPPKEKSVPSFMRATSASKHNDKGGASSVVAGSPTPSKLRAPERRLSATPSAGGGSRSASATRTASSRRNRSRSRGYSGDGGGGTSNTPSYMRSTTASKVSANVNTDRAAAARSKVGGGLHQSPGTDDKGGAAGADAQTSPPGPLTRKRPTRER